MDAYARPFPEIAARTASSPLADALAAPRIAGLDFLRAVAVLLVLADHAGLAKIGPFAVFDGGFGVETFFVLSGFLITWMLLDELDRSADIRLGAFYRRRAARLLPAFYAYLVLGMLALLALGNTVPWGAVAASSVYAINYYQAFTGAQTHYLSHCWSLAVEEQFYLLWPLFLLIVHRVNRNHTHTLIAVVLGVWCLRLALILVGVDDTYLYRALETRADQLAIGGVLACVLRSERGRAVFERAARFPILAVALLAGIELSFLFARDTYLLKYGVGFAADALMVAMLIPLTVLAANRPGIVSSVLNAPMMITMGQISYGIYLFHPFFIVPLFTRTYAKTGSQALGLLVAAAAVTAVAYLSYRFFEAPLRQRLKGS